MPAFNFKVQFSNKVRSGEKRQTIRARGKRRPPRVGESLTFYAGMRTAHCARLGDGVCIGVDAISISSDRHTVQMQRDVCGQPQWVLLDATEIDALAAADGFDSSAAFFDFFRQEHGATFSGYLIRW